MAVRLKDIAEATGFSINTVSRVINENPDVSEKTRKIIQEAAKEMGYVTNSAAKQLRTGKSHSLALILDDFINPHFAIIADEISLYAAELHYNVSIYASNGSAAKEERAIRSAVKNGVDGMILCPTQNSMDNIRLMKNLQVPFILIYRSFNWFKDCSYVVFDESRIGFIAAEHLILKGCRRILSIIFEYQDDSDITASPAMTGIVSAHQTYGLPFHSDLVRGLSLNIRSQREEIHSILKTAADYDCVICSNDMTALTVENFLSSKGVSIPIIGFGNIQKYLPFRTAITSISSAGQSLSICCVDSLMALIGDKSKIQQHTLPVRLIKNES